MTRAEWWQRERRHARDYTKAKAVELVILLILVVEFVRGRI